MSTLQEYWDACLIRAWRNHMTVIDAMKMFYSITGKRASECDLLRFPSYGTPWRTSMRIFTAYYLPKINDSLWDQEPDKDVALLRKLTKSKYNTEKTQYRTNADRDLVNEQQRNRRNRLKNGFETMKVVTRNSSTDWGVTKANVKVRMRK